MSYVLSELFTRQYCIGSLILTGRRNRTLIYLHRVMSTWKDEKTRRQKTRRQDNIVWLIVVGGRNSELSSQSDVNMKRRKHKRQKDTKTRRHWFTISGRGEEQSSDLSCQPSICTPPDWRDCIRNLRRKKNLKPGSPVCSAPTKNVIFNVISTLTPTK